MANSGGLITNPKMPDDFIDVLGIPGNSLIDNCASDQINMWAKYKPESNVTGMANLGKEAISLSQRQLNSFSIQSLQASVYGNVLSLVEDLRAGTVRKSFQYVRPHGSEWRRLSDFNGYWHGAPCPIRTPYTPPNNIVSVSPSGTCQVYFYVDIVGSQYGLGLKDLRFQLDSNTLKDYYFGILLWNDTTYRAYTQQAKMGEGWAEGLAVDFSAMPQEATTYYATPFFSVWPFAGVNNPGNVCSIYPMGFATTEVKTRLERDLVRVSNEAFIWRNDPYTLHLWVAVSNTTDAPWEWSTWYPYSTIRTNPSSPIGKEWILNLSYQVPAHSSWDNDFVIGQLDYSDLIFIDLDHDGANNMSDVNIRYRLHNGEGYYHNKINIRTPE